MTSWWDLGEHSGYRGDELATFDISCAFCGIQGQFGIKSHLEKKNTSGKKLNYDILVCENCANYTMAFWSAGTGYHGRHLVPWSLTNDSFPESWPADVGRYWLQAKRGQRASDWDASAVMARSALQLALRHKGAQGKSLFDEIDDLAMRGDLPAIMKDWAHEVRVLARDPAHPTPGLEATSSRDVADVVKFLGFLLQYLFTLPTDIAAFRARK